MATETIADYTNATTEVLPLPHFQEAGAAALDVPQFRDSVSPSLPSSLTPLQPLQYVDVYIDDFMALVQTLPL